MFSEYPSVFSRITHHVVLAVQMKNWDPLVLGPAFAMERIPGPVCFREKFSSANLHKFRLLQFQQDTSVYSGAPLFQHPGVRTPLYTVEPLSSNTLEWGHLCTQWNPSIPTPWRNFLMCHTPSSFVELELQYAFLRSGGGAYFSP